MRTSTAPSGATVTEFDDILGLRWEWTDEYEGFPPYPHRLHWFRDSVGLIFETRRQSDGEWIGIQVRHPDYQPGNERQAREMAAKFIAAGDDE